MADEAEQPAQDAATDEQPKPTDGTVDELKAHLDGVTDPAELEQIKQDETADKNRATAHAAIDAKADELAAADAAEPKSVEDRLAAIEEALALGDPTLIAHRFAK